MSAHGHRVTLDDVPEVVDAAWIRRHAGLIQCSGEQGLALRPGTPAADALPAREAAPPLPAEPAFEGLVGRDDLLDRLRTERDGARALGEPFPHTLLTGPAGTGKTTLATGLATLLGARLVRTNGPLVRDVAVLLRLLASLGGGDVLFLDEVHAVPPAVLEILYQAMAEGRLSLTSATTPTGSPRSSSAASRCSLPARIRLPSGGWPACSGSTARR